MNSCHRVKRSISYTILKLWADCVKQFVRNVQNCGKTNQGFCTMITCQLTHQCLGVSFWPKNKTVIMPQPPTVFTGLGPADIFLLPKVTTPMKGKCFTMKKKPRNRSSSRYQKLSFRSVSRIGKNAGISVLYLRGGYFEGDKIVIAQ